MAYFENDALRAISNTEIRDLSVAKCQNGKLIVVFRNASSGTWYYCYINDYAVLTIPGWLDSVTPIEFGSLDGNHTQLIYAFNVGEDLFLSASLVKIAAPAYNGTYLYKSPSGNGGDWGYFSTVIEYYWATDKSTWDGNDMPGGVCVTDSGRWVLVGCYHGSYSGAMDCRGAIFISDDDGKTWTRTFTPGSAWGSAGALGYKVVKYDGNLYLLTSYSWGGGGTSLQVSSDDGSTWSSCGSIGGYDYRAALWVGDDGYLYLIRGSQVVWRTNGDPNPVSLLADGGTWELVTTMPGLLSEPDLFGRFSVFDAWGYPIVSLGSYATSSGLALQTCMQCVLVEEVEAGLGSMVYDGKTYRYVETLYQGPITTHPSAGISVEYTYPGDPYMSGGNAYQYLASGVTDPAAEGGFGSYTAETARTVTSLAGREAFVNFYYLVPLVPTVTLDSIHDQTVNGFSAEITLVSDGGSPPITQCGICWSTVSDDFTIDTAENGVALGQQALGSYSALFQGEIVSDVTYYVRAFATNALGTGYSVAQELLIESELPVVETTEVKVIRNLGFDITVNVVEVNDNSCEFGFAWGTSPDPEKGVATTVAIGTATAPGRAKFGNAVDLTPGDTVYYIRAWATNRAGTAYGATLQFTYVAPFWWQFIATPRHARLTHLDDSDDHPQYHNDARGDARYYTKEEILALIGEGGSGGGSYEPIVTSTDPDTPEFLMYEGDIVCGRVI